MSCSLTSPSPSLTRRFDSETGRGELVSSGAVHFRINVAIDCVGIPAAFWFLPEPLAAGVTAGLLIGTLATPDVRDLEQKTYPVWIISRVPLIGRTLAWLFRMFWAPLAIALPHRSRLSHTPVLGTLVAAAYSGCIFYLILSLLQCPLSLTQITEGTQEIIASQCLYAVLFGWCIQDLSHWIADGAPRRPSRRFKPRRN